MEKIFLYGIAVLNETVDITFLKLSIGFNAQLVYGAIDNFLPSRIT